MKKKEEEKKEVILIGEEHRDGSHMQQVTLLVKDKLETYPQVTIALEQKFKDQTLKNFVANEADPSLPQPTRVSPRAKKPVDTIRTKVEKFINGEMYFDESNKRDESSANFNVKAAYINSLTDSIEYAVSKEKDLRIIGADTAVKEVAKERVLSHLLCKEEIEFKVLFKKGLVNAQYLSPISASF